VTQITSSGNFISIDHTASAAFDAFWRVFRLEKERILHALEFSTHKIIFFGESQPRVL